ncbi:Polysaccharide pyruvyl transferase family protein WcaK [Halogranum amylolyticum]|uniref:Polysaccharide pyruvyl transferase family protein WcaK n=1 Tax=Halogranum amylolyticum TaxID=660520 RepID=A0A1H8WSI9_9EURY|nr:polysaccharide pyruvyl transferase family protein [Halogranum amylolyticum]SEP30579.1 Polysaccharide pyruvyl transferase family protein WcaK [Halogranum amylolyticum]
MSDTSLRATASETVSVDGTNTGPQFPTVDGHVLLVGGYGAGNLGDEAILRGLLSALPPTVTTLTVVSHDPEATVADHATEPPAGVDLRAVRPTPTRLLRHLLAVDAVVIGGGGIFSRYMGPYATKLPLFALAALALGRPVHWTAVGVYDSTPERVVRPLVAALRRSDSVTVRDPASLDTLTRWGVSDVRLVDDPATWLSASPAHGRAILADAGVDPDRPVLAIAARRVADPAATDRLFDAYRAVAETYADRGWQLVYLPFCRHPTEPVERDQRVCVALAARCSGTVLPVATASDLLDVVAACDALVATRLHAMLFAHVAETPFVAVSYATKVQSLLDALGHADRGVSLADVSGPTLLDGLDRVTTRPGRTAGQIGTEAEGDAL